MQDYLKIEEYCQECNCKECSGLFTRSVMLTAYLLYNLEDLARNHLRECHSSRYFAMLKDLTKDDITCPTCLSHINEYHYARDVLTDVIFTKLREHAKNSHPGENFESLCVVKHYNEVADQHGTMRYQYANLEYGKMLKRINNWPP